MGQGNGLFLGCGGGGIEIMIWGWVALYGGCLNCFCDFEG